MHWRVCYSMGQIIVTVLKLNEVDGVCRMRERVRRWYVLYIRGKPGRLCDELNFHDEILPKSLLSLWRRLHWYNVNHFFLRALCMVYIFHLVFARDSIYAKRAYAIAIPSVCPSVCPSVRPSVCPSVTRVDQSKTVEARIMQFSPQSSPIPLVFAH